MLLTSTTDEFFSALATSLVSVVSFFIRLKDVNTDRSTSAQRRARSAPSLHVSVPNSRQLGSHPSSDSSVTFLRKRSL